MSIIKNSKDDRFAPLGRPRRIWAISAVHGEVDRLIRLHDDLLERLVPGDRIIYTGNYYGYGPNPAETIDELLTFRRMALAMPGMMISDIIYLRGQQEEIWHKVLQLPFAACPRSTLTWMLDHGLSQTLESYELSPADGMRATREGIPSLTRWTQKIRDRIRQRPGHDIFTTQWRRAAFTESDDNSALLFVNAGLNPKRDLQDQGDSFWWDAQQFKSIDTPYKPFQKVVRGYDPEHKGVDLNCVTATIDGGCGFGGSLICSGFEPGGHLFEMIEA